MKPIGLRFCMRFVSSSLRLLPTPTALTTLTTTAAAAAATFRTITAATTTTTIRSLLVSSRGHQRYHTRYHTGYHHHRHYHHRRPLHTTPVQRMLEINDFRADKGGNPERIRESQRRRHASVELVDQVIALDQEWIKRTFSRRAVVGVGVRLWVGDTDLVLTTPTTTLRLYYYYSDYYFSNPTPLPPPFIVRFQADAIAKQINATQKEITARFKAKEKADDLLAKKESLTQQREDTKKIADDKEIERDRMVCMDVEEEE